MIARCGPAAAVGECIGQVVAGAGGDRWSLEGAVTLGNAGGVLEQAAGLAWPAANVVDCSGLTVVDSAAVTVLLALKRRAIDAGRDLQFVDLPAPLLALADVYDVKELLGVA